MNCQSIKNKKPELQTIVDTSKPDIILGCESWLSPDIANLEIFPDGYDAIRKDWVGYVAIRMPMGVFCMFQEGFDLYHGNGT